jgi:hypothetical protein
VDLGNQLHEVSRWVNSAALEAGRKPKDVSLVAVSKVQPIEKIEAVLRAGHRVFGENRIQEAKEKWPNLKSKYDGIELHLIGALQTNKVREAVSLFDVIETVDRPKLASALKEEMEQQSVDIPCYIQINTGEESQKSGIYPLEAPDFIAYCREDLRLRVCGLMCIPPAIEEPALHFSLLREIAKRAEIKNLSMGMSDDFETAIQLGATHVRLGTAIFGKREV